MKWIALVSWVLTAGFGFVMLGIFIARGGLRQAGADGPRIRPPLVLSHFALAAIGLLVWLYYVFTDNDTSKWIAFVILLVVAVLGWTMFAFWYQRRRRASTGDTGGAPGGGTVAMATTGTVAEQHFPIAVVTVHGLLAVATVVLVLLTAVGVGGS